MWPRSLTYLNQNLVIWPEPHIVPISKFMRLCVFKIFNHKMHIYWPRCQAIGVAMATILNRTGWAVVVMLTTKYEVDVTTHDWVMAHFTRIHYMPVWPRSLTYLHQKWVAWPGPNREDICLFWSLCAFAFLTYTIINCKFRGPVARQPLRDDPGVSALVWSW